MTTNNKILKSISTKLYEIDFKKANHKISNSVFSLKRNYNFLNVVLRGFKKRNKLQKADFLFNIENYTHLREVTYLLKSIQNKKVVIISENIQIENYFDNQKYKLIYTKNQRLNSVDFLCYIYFFIFSSFFKTVEKLFLSNNLKYSEKVFRYNKSKFIYFYFIYKYLLNEVKPKYCFVGNDLTFNGRLLALISKTKTISIQHGNIYNDFKSSRHIVKIFCCYNEYSKKVLEKSYSGKLILTGSFFHKNVFKLKFVVSKLFNLDLKLSYHLIGFSGPGHSTSFENYKYQLEIINDLVIKFSNQNFIIKPHPKEDLIYYKDILKQKNVSLINGHDIFKFYSIYPLLDNVKSVITGLSTIAIEGMLKEKKIICLDPLNEYKNDYLVSKNLLLYANNKNKLFHFFTNENSFKKNGLIFSRNYFGINNKNILKDIIEL